MRLFGLVDSAIDGNDRPHFLGELFVFTGAIGPPHCIDAVQVGVERIQAFQGGINRLKAFQSGIERIKAFQGGC